MEVYVLDSLFRRTQVFDVFESLIWTERFVDIGDFELHIKSTLESRSAFTRGTCLAINNSFRVMMVETVEDNTDANGKSMLSVKGHSIETMMKERIYRDNWIENGSITNDFTDTPGNIARDIFNQVAYFAAGFDATTNLDRIPFLPPWTGTNVWPYVNSDLFPPDTIPEPADVIHLVQGAGILYDIIKKICDAYDFGFRLVRNFDLSQLYFDIYTGRDLTTRQTDFTPVIFSADLENLQNTTEFSNIDGSKNVAYVYSDYGLAEVYGVGVDPEVSGFERRVLLVDASGEVDATTVDVPGTLQSIGQRELAQYRAQEYFDGEINQNGDFKYGVDYQLGDLVEQRNRDGVTTYKRVTEQIFVDDEQGERSYPTLSLDVYIGLNTWLTYGSKSTVWLDFDALPDTWADMD